MCVSSKEMSFFCDLIWRSTSSCPRRSPFSAKARFACGRFAGAPLELTLPRFFPSRVVSRSICFIRSKQARTTSSSAPRFAAKRSTTASFSQHERRKLGKISFWPPFFRRSREAGRGARHAWPSPFLPPFPLRKRAIRRKVILAYCGHMTAQGTPPP